MKNTSADTLVATENSVRRWWVMKFTVPLAALMVMSSLALTGQTRKQINWQPCQDVVDKLKEPVEKFNAEHKDGFEIQLSCAYSGDPQKRMQPKHKVPLTNSEISHLYALRKVEDAAFGAMGEYEDYLFRAHGIRKPKIDEPCFYFVGIVFDTDFITVDPNPMDPQC